MVCLSPIGSFRIKDVETRTADASNRPVGAIALLGISNRRGCGRRTHLAGGRGAKLNRWAQIAKLIENRLRVAHAVRLCERSKRGWPRINPLTPLEDSLRARLLLCRRLGPCVAHVFRNRQTETLFENQILRKARPTSIPLGAFQNRKPGNRSASRSQNPCKHGQYCPGRRGSCWSRPRKTTSPPRAQRWRTFLRSR